MSMLAFEVAVQQMKAVLLIITLVIVLLLSICLVGLLMLWARGFKTILLPGLGLVVATPVLLIIFTTLTSFLLVFAVVLFRY